MSGKAKNKGKKIKSTDFKIKGKETWVNKETGEVRETLSAEVNLDNAKPERPPFMICVLNQILKLTDIVGNKKMQVVNYILSNMSKSGKYSNVLMITQKELAKKSNVSIQTVSITLKELEKANIIQKKTGAIMLHPDLAMVGDGRKRQSLIVDFKNFEEDNNE